MGVEYAERGIFEAPHVSLFLAPVKVVSTLRFHSADPSLCGVLVLIAFIHVLSCVFPCVFFVLWSEMVMAERQSTL
jgi:hypothetical protein